MEIIIRRFDDGSAIRLTTDSPASHYGIPALRYDGCDCPDRGPAETLCEHAYHAGVVALFGAQTAAAEVLRVASDLHRNEYAAAQAFLGQWPDGPQVPPYPVPALPVEGHWTRDDGLKTFWSGVLTLGVVNDTPGLPIVVIEGTRRTDDPITLGRVDPQACLPLTLERPATLRERALLDAALRQGYRLDPRSPWH